ncbi:hypothetical protein ACFPMF_10865 [Larkinella bovis]|uniref:Nucleotide exchange factor GrpE n=1 Tax=Larkinella bovis TaxID=683041 RepID=A0ABW0I8D9_9BACT
MEPKENKPSDQEPAETYHDQDSEPPAESAQANRMTEEHRAPNDPAEGPRE